MARPFSHVYCIPEISVAESSRFRGRLGSYATKLDTPWVLAERIERETGVRVPYVGTQKSLDVFFQKAEMRDVLDAITHIYAYYVDLAKLLEAFPSEASSAHENARAWKAFVQRVAAEEHMAYEIDEDCQVRYAVDEAYALSRKATLAGLQDSRWNAVRAEFERAFAALDGDKKDTNGAIRAMAASVESCVKVIIGNGIARIGPPEIEKYLWPTVQVFYKEDRVAALAGHQMLKALSDWITAAHQYRHGQDSEHEVSAPFDLAIQFLSSGASFIRWLIGSTGAVRPAA